MQTEELINIVIKLLREYPAHKIELNRILTELYKIKNGSDIVHN